MWQLSAICNASAMGVTRLRATTKLVKGILTLTAATARETRALHRAARKMPKPMPWDWAAPRMLPILCGPSFDPPGESLVRARSELGPMVQFGVDLGGVFAYVDTPVAQRWECTPAQFMERALHNLHERASHIPKTQVVTGVMSGRSIRVLSDRPDWASSIVLDREHLFRLFGDHDQVVGAPTMSCLVSLPIDTPPNVVADILVDFEREAYPRILWLDPFLIEDRRISWIPVDVPGDDLDD
jgi:hypothetical protein